METPLVSVCMITYNHAPYIAKAIEGVMMQKCDFPIELIIGEDCSTDDTRAIVLKYKEMYPDKIRLLLRVENVGMQKNFVETLQAATGKYIALCEGDDYWIDPYKLQKQVFFLENNSVYSMCFHPVDELIDKNWTRGKELSSLHVGEYSGEDILKKWSVATCSVLFRNCNLEKCIFRLQNRKYLFGDIILFLSLAENGKLYCFTDDIMGVYRRHLEGVTITNNSHKKRILHYQELLTDFKCVYKKTAKNILFDLYLSELKKKITFSDVLGIGYYAPYQFICYIFRKAKSCIKTIMRQ